MRARMEQKKERAQQYYRAHRQAILAKHKQANAIRYHCSCGANVGASRREAHEYTEKHQRYVMAEQLNALMSCMREKSLSPADGTSDAAVSNIGRVT